MAPLKTPPDTYTIDSYDEDDEPIVDSMGLDNNDDDMETTAIRTQNSMTSQSGKHEYDTLDPLASSNYTKKKMKQRMLFVGLVVFIFLLVKVQNGSNSSTSSEVPAPVVDDGNDNINEIVSTTDDDDYYKMDDEEETSITPPVNEPQEDIDDNDDDFDDVAVDDDDEAFTTIEEDDTSAEDDDDEDESTIDETATTDDDDEAFATIEEDDTSAEDDDDEDESTIDETTTTDDDTTAEETIKSLFEDNFYIQQNNLSDEEKDELIEKWGKWHFWDGDPESRPTCDYLAGFPNGDIPAEEIPYSAWQADAVYANHFIDSSAELVRRAKEAIYTEYGWGPREDMTVDQLMDRMEMFEMDFVDLDTDPDSVTKAPSSSSDNGGWTTEKSFAGLSRRLLHAIMTQDDFTVVMGGHSAAAGHGNHFLQSYMMQFHKIMEPIFRRLGVNLITRNIAHGGLGTLQNTLGASSLYGDKIDMMLWDSSMTEKGGTQIDLFYRQALIAGQRPPVLIGGHFDLLKDLYINADADVMQLGSAMVGIPLTENMKQVEELPFAAQYLKCSKGCKDLCEAKENRFRTTCWVDRDDVTPPTPQSDHAGSQVSWHPGFRNHQLTGRVLAFAVLDAIQDALDQWSEVSIVNGFPIPDEMWHMTDYYENIQSKARALGPDVGKCSEIDGLPERVCTTPLKGRSEFTPRANPDETSITSILKPTPDGYIPQKKEELLYEGPDVPNPSLMLPEGEVDVRAIVSNRRQLSQREINEFVKPTQAHLHSQTHEEDLIDNANAPADNKSRSLRRRLDSKSIIPGEGWELAAYPGYCDGTSAGICHRTSDSNCLLYGHMDNRGGISGNPLSGWLVMTIPDVKEGLIMLKMETFHKETQIEVTKDWSEVNDGHYNRQLKGDAYNYPENFVFEYAINGVITTMDKAEFKEKLTKPQRVVEILTVLDDENFVKGDEAEEVEVAIRLLNSEHMPVFKLTHVYWA